MTAFFNQPVSGLQEKNTFWSCNKIYFILSDFCLMFKKTKKLK